MTRRIFLLSLLASTSVLVAPAVESRDWRPGLTVQVQNQPGARNRAAPPSRADRMPRGDRARRDSGRLTPEERRALNRDLDRANREIYRRHFKDK